MEMTQFSGARGAGSADRVSVPAPRGNGPAAAANALRLADLNTGAVARVLSVASVDAGGSGELGRRLAELGFLPGEKLRIVARGFMGREPIAVRIGTGTFALRLFEAACISVCPEHSSKV